MNDTDTNEIRELDCEERYDLFLNLVAESREIFILTNKKNEFLRISSEEEDLDYLPVWPHPEFCKPHLADSDEPLSVTALSAIEFFSKWVKGLSGDALKVGVFPKLGDDVWITEPEQLKKDLQEAFTNMTF